MNAYDLLDNSSDEDDRNIPAARNFRQWQYFELEDFEERFGLSRTQFTEFSLLIGRDIESATARSAALSTTDKLLIALRFYASGGEYYNIGDAHGPSKASVSQAIRQVTAVINLRLFQVYVRWPDPVGNLANRFFNYAGMPCVAGALDGTLVTIIAPPEHRDNFIDRHGGLSLNTMFTCGPNLRFYDCSIR